ncbi:MAG: YegP family protein [Candidatus Eisenbacteria bacterium]|uniref:YegP family protein n=1 Tax=Eiseniibacteriota bacterium TaxID=2212470 RepID=A0A7Y2EC35_UNCEI|nr:YegP family protein [Candidatus Eisenbacteria bacterium]
MFNLKAGNGETILTSERYTTKAKAENGIVSVQENSPKDSQYEKRDASNGQPYFVLKAANHQIIGTSARDNGIESVKTNGPRAAVDDQT